MKRKNDQSWKPLAHLLSACGIPWIWYLADFIFSLLISMVTVRLPQMTGAIMQGEIFDKGLLAVSAVTALTAIFVVFVCVEIAMGVNFFSLDKQSADYVIVLGAQVRGKALSRTLEYRLEKALEYARVHPNTVLVLSGGQGAGEEMTEAEAMYEYLKAHGIPESQMLLEEQSASTYENLVYSKLLIQEREAKRRQTIRDVMAASGYLSPPDEEVSIRVGIITSNFHVLRAKAIAKKTGIPGITGIAAKSDPVLFLHFSVRECFAILKDKFVGNM